MTSWAVTDLRGERTWDIDRFTVEAYVWPSQAPLLRLDEVTRVLVPGEDADPEYPVITPRCIDNVSGVLRRRDRSYVGPAFRVGGYGRSLQPGDILLPPFDAPALLVNESLMGSLVSSQFLTLRAEAVDPYWLWGVLNSRSGRSLRRLLTAGASGRLGVHSALLTMQVPVPPAAEQHSAAATLATIEFGLRGQEAEAPTTWWKVGDLRGSEWRFALAAANPALHQDGEPLSQYADVFRGRQSRSRDDEIPGEGDAVLPLATGMFLAGRRTEVAPVLHDSLIAQPGDVLVASIGERPMAQVVGQSMVVSNTVYLIRPHSPERAPAIARFLNGVTGSARWRFLALDGMIPQMRLSDLRSFPVPAGALDEFADIDLPVGPLDAQIESILWPS